MFYQQILTHLVGKLQVCEMMKKKFVNVKAKALRLLFQILVNLDKIRKIHMVN